MLFVTSLIFIITGVLYIIFAYRAPPKAIEHLFRIPAIFIFFPEHNRVRLGRITLGVLIGLTGVGWAMREIYQQLHWILAH